MSTVKTKYFEYGSIELNYLVSMDTVLGAEISHLGRGECQAIPNTFIVLGINKALQK